MSRPLLLSYFFPPIGGAGAQRPARLVRHLTALGYSPTVVTGSGKTVGRWTPRDATLIDEIPPSVHVLRTTDEPFQPEGWEGRAERWLGIASRWPLWWKREAVAKGLEVDGVDVVYTIMPPYASAEASYTLSRTLGKPWIADLGDPWALDEMMIYPSALHRRRELRRMRQLLGTAAAIVTTTPEAARRIRAAFPELADRPVVSIPCGFDAADFAGPPPERDDDVFRIVHTGYLHTDLGRQQHRMSTAHRLVGGTVAGVDILTRSHVYLLQAVDRLVARDPDLASRIEILLAGVMSEADREVAERSPLVRTLGYLSHGETIELMRSADLLFLPMQSLPPGRRSATVPGKTYEYLAAQRPILAAVPEGDARDLLLQAGNAHVCAPADIAAMELAIAEELYGTSSLRAVDAPLLARFAYGNLAERVAEVLDGVTSPTRRTRAIRGVGAVSSVAVTRAETTGESGLLGVGSGPSASRILLLAYYFPPIGGAGAQRSLKLVRYLPEAGYTVDVLTGTGVSGDRWSPRDETMLAELPEGATLHRATGPEPGRGGRWQIRAEAWLGVETSWTRWWVEGVVAKGLELGRDADAIIASMSPYHSAEAAQLLSRKLGKPWIAGLRDPWALDEMMIYPSALHRRRELRRMRQLLGTAAAIVTTTPEAARRIRAAFPELADRPVVSIPCGFDAADFAGPPPERDDDVFRIVHTGYLHTDLGRQQHRMSTAHRLVGGTVAGVDILTRSHVYLLQAVDRLVARDPDLASRIEILLAGVMSEADREVAERSPLVRTLGYLSHGETIELMRSADLLFLPMQSLPPGRRSATVPGKTYEYLAAQRPILAAVPEGDARDLLLQAGNAHVCAPADIAAMELAVETELERVQAGRQVAEVSPVLLERFERRNLAIEYAAVIDAAARPGTGRSALSAA